MLQLMEGRPADCSGRLEKDGASSPAVVAELKRQNYYVEEFLSALVANNDEARSQEWLTQAASHGSPGAAGLLAMYYLQQGKDSVPTWTRLSQMEANPYSALAYLMLGDLCKNKGEKDAARTWYQQCVAKCPTSTLVTNKTIEMRLALLDVDAPTQVEAVAQPQQQENPLGNPFGETPEVGNTEFNPGI